MCLCCVFVGQSYISVADDGGEANNTSPSPRNAVSGPSKRKRYYEEKKAEVKKSAKEVRGLTLIQPSDF